MFAFIPPAIFLSVHLTIFFLMAYNSKLVWTVVPVASFLDGLATSLCTFYFITYTRFIPYNRFPYKLIKLLLPFFLLSAPHFHTTTRQPQSLNKTSSQYLISKEFVIGSANHLKLVQLFIDIMVLIIFDVISKVPVTEVSNLLYVFILHHCLCTDSVQSTKKS